MAPRGDFRHRETKKPKKTQAKKQSTNISTIVQVPREVEVIKKGKSRKEEEEQ